MKKLFITLALLLPSIALAAGLTLPQGGLGTTTVPANWVLIGQDANRITAVATSSLGITGGSGVTGGTAGMLAAFTSATALTATSGPTASYYTATSTTATSTFNGTTIFNAYGGFSTSTSITQYVHVGGTSVITDSGIRFNTTRPNQSGLWWNNATTDFGNVYGATGHDGSVNAFELILNSSGDIAMTPNATNATQGGRIQVGLGSVMNQRMSMQYIAASADATRPLGYSNYFDTVPAYWTGSAVSNIDGPGFRGEMTNVAQGIAELAFYNPGIAYNGSNPEWAGAQTRKKFAVTTNGIWANGLVVGTTTSSFRSTTTPPVGGAIFQGNVGIATSSATRSQLTIAGTLGSTIDVGTGIVNNTGTPSYSNPGGTGNRTASITVTAQLPGGFTGPLSSLVDGTTAGDTDFFFTGGTYGDSWIKFDFGSGKIINEMKWYQDTSTTHFTDAQWEGSNDNSAWTVIGSTFTLGGATPFQTNTTMSANTTSYRYYRIHSAAGLVSGVPYDQEIEFKVAAAGTQNEYTKIQAYNSVGIATSSLILQPVGGTVGIATTTPWGQLSVTGTSTTNTIPVFAIASSTNKAVFYVDGAGHQYASTTVPTLSSCGTSPSLVGNDNSGTITVGSVSATGCTVTFGVAWTSAPNCVISNQNMSITNALTYTITATALTISQTGLTNAKVNYNCSGNGI